MPDYPIKPVKSIMTHSSESSNWDSYTSIGNVLKSLMGNMTFLNCVESTNGDVGNDEPTS